MELDVHLKREGEESWGFRLIGGKDFAMPLTVVKVVPGSPAAVAGLQNGDTVCSFNGAGAGEMAHDDAKQFVAHAVELTLGVKRGLYDPVLNDYEPIYESIDQEDFDQPSQPTEVDPFKIQQFLDPNKTPERLSELRDIETPGFVTPGLNQNGSLTPGFYQNGLDQSRSLTASPFLLPSKPYRPFSTEPLPIPALEDPIILNPGYADQFGKYDDDEFGLLPETRFKLPISEQYDPDGTRKKRSESERKEVSVEDTKKTKINVSVTDSYAQDSKQKAVEETKFIATMKKDIDLNKIEMTAASVVDESIERAVSVTDEIKKEIDVALRESSITSSKVEESKSVMESSKFMSETSKTESVKENVVLSTQSAKEANELAGLLDKTTEEIISYNGSKTEKSVAKAVQKFKSLDKKEQIVDERKLSTKQEIEETIEVGSVRRKSEAFDKVAEAKASSELTEKVKTEATRVKTVTEKDLKTQEQSQIVTEKQVQKQACNAETVSQNAQKTTEVKKEAVTSQKTSATTSSDTKTTKQYGEQKAYKIGLQTIPNIKGTIHSSYHYNLLLKTFFLHLTDVMVALSRFILTEPVFNKSEESQVTKDIVVEESVSKREEKYVSEDKFVEEKHKEKAVIKEAVKEAMPAVISKKEEIVEVKKEKQNLIESKVVDKVFVKEKAAQQKEVMLIDNVSRKIEQAQVIEKTKFRDDFQENLEVETIMDRKEKRSGAQMAQLQERKSAELTEKMDAVISEFHNKAGIEDLETTRERRSRSKSKEVKLESSHETEISKIKNESKSFSSTTESTETKRLERHSKSDQSSKSEEGKQMYVAIVESHVFTNKDAIFEEQATDFSETSSVISANETNIALRTSEVIATEKVALESQEIKQEVAETILEESRELSIVNAQTETVVEVAEDKQSTAVMEETKAIIEEAKEEKAVEVETKVMHEVVIQEIIEPVVEIQETKAVQISEDYQQLSVKEEEHIMTVSEKTEISVAETHESIEVLGMKQEEQAVVSLEERKAVEVVKEEPKKVIVPPVETELKVVQRARSRSPVYQEESVALTIVKPASTPTETEKTFLIAEESELSVNKLTEISESDSQYTETHKSNLESYESNEIVQEASFTAKASQHIEQESTFTAKFSSQMESETHDSSSTAKSEHKKLTLQMDLTEDRKLETSSSGSSIKSTIETPTPSTVPPTPLTDEYVFKLKAPMPKNRVTELPRDCTLTPEPVEEDPNIVKKKLIPHIETILESPVIYDPPLPSPPLDKVTSPVYTKPGLKGGANWHDFRKEEILEIERKSSLLASAIDETIKSIEEYKEEVGIETKKDFKIEESSRIENTSSKTVEEHTHNVTTSKQEFTINSSIEPQPIIYNGYAKVETKVYDTIENNHVDDEWNKIDQSDTQVKSSKDSSEEPTDLSIEVDVEVDFTLKANEEIKPEEQISHEIAQKETINSSIDAEKLSSEFNKENNIEETTAEFTIKSDKMSLVNGQDTSTLFKATNGFAEETLTTTDLKFKASTEVVNNFEHVEESREVTTTNGHKDVDVTLKPEVPAMNGFKNERGSSMFVVEEKKDPMEGYRPIQFNPEELQATKKGLQSIHLRVQPVVQRAQSPSYVDSKGELLGTRQGIVDGLEEAVVYEELARELGKPGMTEQKIAELISGESEMLREAHVMGLSRVLKSHMHRADDDSSVDFKKIKPILESLKDSEVLKALNDEIERQREEKRKEEEKKWTTFLQKPKRPVPKAKFGYPGYVEEEEKPEVPYKVKIVKQPKPKVAPDYKPENFETGPLPWEERALNEPPPPPVAAEDPILVPEELPEFLEAVDPLPESEVPDLEETGIPLPQPEPVEESTPSPAPEEAEEELEEEEAEELDLEAVVEETQEIVAEMEQNRLAEQLLSGVQSMVDPNASIDQQLAQMRAQLAALAQLPCVIQQTLDLVTKQLSHLSQQETQQTTTVCKMESHSEMTSEEQEYVQEVQSHCEAIEDAPQENGLNGEHMTNEDETEKMTIVEVVDAKPSLTQEELEKLRKEEEEMLEEQRRIEKQKKDLMEKMQLEHESRQVKQHPTPRVGKPKPVFGPPEPVARPLVLPGGRRWRKPEDAYNEAFFAETLSAQAELIQGKTKGFSYESDKLPYDERINFMKYEKPPVSLDHLQNSETYKLIHNMEQSPANRLELRTPVIAESDYREKCRSVTPSNMASRLSIPQQVEP